MWHVLWRSEGVANKTGLTHEDQEDRKAPQKA